jgi:KDO2-lipid IV(A) lauroyltransferase
MSQPARYHKTRPPARRRKRPKDLADRQPFARMPWWLRALTALPLGAWYAICRFFAWLAEHVVRHRRHVVDMQIAACFPDRSAEWRREVRHRFYLGFGQVAAEIIKAATITPDEIHRRLSFEDDAPVRAALAAGQSIMVVTSHNCNWEWLLLKLSLDMGHPIHAAYKPLKGRFGDRLMLTIRSRFGAEMIAAQRLLMRVMRSRGPARVVAVVADQAPTSSGVRYFTRLFGLDTAFFVGPEAIARAAGLPVWYLAMRRRSRGRYHVRFVPLAASGEALAEGRLLERYAAALEALTREEPADWLWNYRRWKVQRDAEGNPVIVKSGEISAPN